MNYYCYYYFFVYPPPHTHNVVLTCTHVLLIERDKLYLSAPPPQEANCLLIETQHPLVRVWFCSEVNLATPWENVASICLFVVMVIKKWESSLQVSVASNSDCWRKPHVACVHVCSHVRGVIEGFTCKINFTWWQLARLIYLEWQLPPKNYILHWLY